MEFIVPKIQKELKKRAKAKDLNYSQIAELLDISEATVKRLFNHEDISFSKLNELCSVLEIEFFELVDLIRDEKQSVYHFTMDQELLLAKSELNFKIFRAMLAGKTYEKLKNIFSLKDKDLYPLLNKFENCGLIRLGVHNKLKVLATFPLNGKMVDLWSRSFRKLF